MVYADMDKVLIVRKLREDTGEPMMHCKKALIASDWDYEKAKQWLKDNPYPLHRLDGGF